MGHHSQRPHRQADAGVRSRGFLPPFTQRFRLDLPFGRLVARPAPRLIRCILAAMPADLNFVASARRIESHEVDWAAAIDSVHSLLSEDALPRDMDTELARSGVIPEVLRVALFDTQYAKARPR
jgi:hypothetical protein